MPKEILVPAGLEDRSIYRKDRSYKVAGLELSRNESSLKI
jgi:hypothetical protein